MSTFRDVFLTADHLQSLTDTTPKTLLEPQHRPAYTAWKEKDSDTNIRSDIAPQCPFPFPPFFALCLILSHQRQSCPPKISESLENKGFAAPAANGYISYPPRVGCRCPRASPPGTAVVPFGKRWAVWQSIYAKSITKV